MICLPGEGPGGHPPGAWEGAPAEGPGGGRLHRLGPPPPPRGARGGGGEAPTDYTKPRQTIQLKRLYKD